MRDHILIVRNYCVAGFSSLIWSQYLGFCSDTSVSYFKIIKNKTTSVMLKIFEVLYFERKNNTQLAFPGHSEVYKQQH